jgi:DNA repair exonuclease SbcCD ATPase subunit
MATTQTPAQAPAKHRNVWIWVSAALGAVAVALLVWGLSTKSDLDDANSRASQLEEQIAQGKHAASNGAASYQYAYQTIEDQLGQSKEDLAGTEQDLEDAQAKTKQAQQDAADAKSQAEKANAEAQAAQEQLKVAQDCVKAFASAGVQVAQSADPKAEAEKVKPELQAIASDCRAALTG